MRDGEDYGQALQERGLHIRNGIPRSTETLSAAQKQTEDVFEYKWSQRASYESLAGSPEARSWLEQRYGAAEQMPFLADGKDRPILLDAGCGSGYSALALFQPIFERVRYLGADVSSAVDVARERFLERNLADVAFIQANIVDLPLPDECVDVIFSEGVLHHTDSTRDSLFALTKKLRPGGWMLFYVYRKKGPVREFTDDFIRQKLQSMSPERAWAEMLPLTKLGRALGELNIDIEIPEEISVLQIPAGKISLQRFVYWHIFKAFYRPGMSLDEMCHINFDWYAPRNAHRHSPEEIRAWCQQAGLRIRRETVEESGITIVAEKRVL